MSQKNPKVEAHFEKAKSRKAERLRLRELALESGLDEELKWGKPCYCYEKANVAILYALKDNAAIGFFKGSLMKDPNKLMMAPGENSQAARWMKFSSLAEVEEKAPVISAYLDEAIAIEKAGLKVDFKAKGELVLVDELQDMMAADDAFRDAFEALTPGRKRGYNLFFAGAKQSATRISRIEKSKPKIFDGKGLHDR
ncbi:MAG: hypothetical protein EP348_08265 [Alphaproteobacteria bacterium]|nr:MAG: hypothetical protein EP348_08265 [Alphaproteobacteria bacterium]